MAYGGILAKLAGAGGGGAPPMPAAPAHGVGVGQPPNMPGLPPAPTGVGAMPTGNLSTTAKGAADNAIESLTEVKGYYPSLAPAIQTCIDAIRAAAQPKPPAAPGGPAALAVPSPPGTAPPEVPGPELSGSPGAM